MKHLVLLLGCLLWMNPGVQAGELYRWVDANGKVHYGDVPPPEAAQLETMKIPPAPAPDEYLPYETRLAQQNFPVTLYVADSCVEYCEQARRLLNNRGIPYIEKKLLTRENADVLKALSGFDNVPVLAVGKVFLQGFLAPQWHSELDAAGYPQIAPYRPAVTPPAAAPVPVSEETVPPAASEEVAPPAVSEDTTPAPASEAVPANPAEQ